MSRTVINTTAVEFDDGSTTSDAYLIHKNELKGERKKYSKRTHLPTNGLASTSRMRKAITPGQWQPWTAVSPLLAMGLISMAEPGRARVSKTPFYCQGEHKALPLG